MWIYTTNVYLFSEQIYLQEVVYNKAKPYTNFIDVLNNNQGVVSVVQEEHYKFDKIDDGDFTLLVAFKEKSVKGFVCNTKTQAEKINTYLNQYAKAFDDVNKASNNINRLIGLVK